MLRISITPTTWKINSISFEYDRGYSADIFLELYKKETIEEIFRRGTRSFPKWLSIYWFLKEDYILVSFKFQDLPIEGSIKAQKVEVDDKGIYIYTADENKIIDELSNFEDIDIIKLKSVEDEA